MKENLLYIINKYGVNNQQRKLMEEIFELQEAIIKWENMSSTPGYMLVNELKEHIEEEFADVLNILEQFKIYYELDDDNIYKIRKQKIDRTLERIK